VIWRFAMSFEFPGWGPLRFLWLTSGPSHYY
jgi:hypothetical protein